MSAVLNPGRVGRLTGSRVAAVLGESRYEKPADVLRAMVREALGAPTEFTGNLWTDWGQTHEQDALTAYEAREWVDVHSQQLFLTHPVHDLLAVTVDGLVEGDGLVEVKCPPRARYTVIPKHYLPQVLLQLAVTGREWADFVVWRTEARAHELGVDPLVVQRIHRDDTWLPRVLPVLQDFHAEYVRIVADAGLAAPFLADREAA